MSSESPRPSLTRYRAALGFKALIPASVSAILPFPYVSKNGLETYSRLETCWRHKTDWLSMSPLGHSRTLKHHNTRVSFRFLHFSGPCRTSGHFPMQKVEKQPVANIHAYSRKVFGYGDILET